MHPSATVTIMLSHKPRRTQGLHHKALLQAGSELGQLYSTSAHPGSLAEEAAALIGEEARDSQRFMWTHTRYLKA